ncbi:hypothetical protein HYE67_005859 [Fusarium culmorum]|uniref:Uncharacterized protein n=1 Tax=Fusarium culmorum TaxID=5516 RepID=A0A7S8D7W3_FUSCU|nr:hypothetical protein HYE67_005859 [Fusarium culmorum]
MELVKWMKPGNDGAEAEDADKRRSSSKRRMSAMMGWSGVVGPLARYLSTSAVVLAQPFHKPEAQPEAFEAKCQSWWQLAL